MTFGSDPTPLTITTRETDAPPDDRFDRFKLIGWWDQEKLKAARVLVVGAGALGNEIVKNLAMLGVGNIMIVDMDRIENSNLSRSVLYRAADNGQFKADVAARAAREIYPEMNVRALVGSITDDVGVGVFRWADVVLGGLDNREARLFINRACYRFNKPWIDGAIETVQGTARVFVPEGHAACAVEGGPCYECTMSDNDWRLLQLRRSCNLLSRAEMETGKTPTTPTISSIIAGVQCQEAVKLLHGLDVPAGRAWVFEGISSGSYTIEFQRKPDCLSHEPVDDVIELPTGAHDTTAAELFEVARKQLGGRVELEFPREILRELVCPRCKQVESVFLPLTKVKYGAAVCPHCGPEVQRAVETFFKLRGDEPFLNRSLADLGAAPFDVIVARGTNGMVGFELSADAPAVLGDVWRGEEGLDLL